MFEHDFTGVEESSGFPVIPGERVWNVFEIENATELKSKNDDNMVKVEAVCVSPEFAGVKVYHYVTFIPKGKPGAGIAKHFCSVIGEANDGVSHIDAFSWMGRRFKGCTIVDEYEGKKKNKFVDTQEMENGPAGHMQKPTEVAGNVSQAPDTDEVPY